jgi:uncharacterized phage-associated protein
MVGTTYAPLSVQDQSPVQNPASNTNSLPIQVYQGGTSVIVFDEGLLSLKFDMLHRDLLQVLKDAPKWTEFIQFDTGLMFASSVTPDEPSPLEESQAFLQHLRQMTDGIGEKGFLTPSGNSLANVKRRAKEGSQSRGYSELNCYDIAQYFLAQRDDDAGDLISNLKLQKLVYYAQGFSLALYDRPLFPERIEAWTHGPVVPGLYYEYKNYGSGALPFPSGCDFSSFNAQTRELLDEVYATYGQFSAWKLRDMTLSEPPWCDTPVGQEIQHDGLSEYFATRTARGWETE